MDIARDSRCKRDSVRRLTATDTAAVVYRDGNGSQWVMGQMGHHFWMGHMGRGSLPLTHDNDINVQ